MEISNCFILEGTRDLIFRKEREEYMFFDPLSLECYSINESGAEILCLISKQKKLEDILEYFIDNYEISLMEIKEFVLEFLFEFPLIKIILPILIQLDIHEELTQWKRQT